jgi:hypothetical protein
MLNEKKLLLNDLCARLNTKLVCSIYRTDDQGIGYRDEILHGYCKGDIWYEFYFSEDCSISIDNVSKIKPYLFPLSSMTEAIKDEIYQETGLYDIFEDNQIHIEVGTNFADVCKLFNILNKYYLDYNGLIPKGLAKDATGLNIY